MPPPENIPAGLSPSGVLIQTFAAMGSGRTIAKIEDALREATRAARESGVKAKVNIDITITPNGEGVGGTPLFKLTGKVKKTLPEKPETAAVFFADDDDNLTRRNPRQEEMKLTTMDGGKGPTLKDAQPAAAASQ